MEYKKLKKASLILTLVLSALLLASSMVSAISVPKTSVFQSTIRTTQAESKPVVLKIGVSGYWNPPTLLPFLDWYASECPVFGYLVVSNGSGLIERDHAKNWILNGDRCTMTIFDDITWHDGQPLNATDIKYTIDMMLYSDNPDIVYWWGWLRDIVSSVDILNSTAVVFHLTQSWASFLYWIDAIPILPEHILNGTDITTHPYNDNPIGSGQFRFVNWTKGVEMYLQAYEGHSTNLGGRSDMDYIQFKWGIPLVESLESNTVDLIGGDDPNAFIEPSEIASLESTTGTTTTDFFEPVCFEVDINVTNTYLSDRTVRQAINYAIDRDRMCQEIFLGYALPAVNHIHPSSSWFKSDLSTIYDPTEAEKLLDEAGYLRDPGTGIRFNLEFKAGNYNPPRVIAAQIFAENLNSVGINTTIVWKDYGGLWDDFWSSNYELIGVWGWWVWIDPDLALYNYYHSGGSSNTGGFNNSTIDYLLELGRTTTEYAARKQIYDWVQGNLTIEVPSFPLYFRTPKIAYNNDFWGFTTQYVLSPYTGNSLKKVSYDAALSGEGQSPVKIAFKDSLNRITGWDPETETYVTEIPGSEYLEDQNIVKIRSPEETKIEFRTLEDGHKIRIETPSLFAVDVMGTGDGSYRLELVSISLEYKHTIILEGNITEGEVHRYWLTVQQGGRIIRSYYPTYLKRMIFMGTQIIIPHPDVDPRDYDTRHTNTIVPL